MSSREAEYKPLLFTTTVRNPSRIKSFIKILSNYSNKILNNETIMKIVYDMIFSKNYWTIYEKNNKKLWEIYKSEDDFTSEQVFEIIENSPQDHKEAGFDHGWPSRFDTWFKFIKELGFIYYEMDNPIIVSETGQLLLNSDINNNPELEEQAFLNALVKYQRNNPFRRVSNENAPFSLVIKVLNLLKKNPIKDNSTISRKEIPLILCSKDDDAERIYKQIKNIRSKFGFEVSDDIIYGICLEELNAVGQNKRFKLKNIMREMPDDFIRKMRLTGLITLRGYGRFIDYNTEEIDKINYILEKYYSYTKYNLEYEYYKYMSNIDKELVNIKSVFSIEKVEDSIEKWSKYFELELLKDELKILIKDDKSKDDILKIIDAPTRLEFIISIILKKQLEGCNVVPNYLIDDEGLPRRHAGGGVPDITCFDDNYNTLFEVTLLTGSQQCVRELPSVGDHLRAELEKKPSSFSVFVAPKLNSRSIEYAEFLQYKEGLKIISYSILDFINIMETSRNLESLL